jgi:hypothetical protein
LVPLAATEAPPWLAEVAGLAEAQRRGLRVLLGDSRRTRTMEEAGIRRAGFVVIADDEPAGHPIIRSVEPGERWGHCFADDLRLEPVRTPA